MNKNVTNREGLKKEREFEGNAKFKALEQF
jgi:hypothetical protein